MVLLVKNLLYSEKYTIDGARQKLDEFRRNGGIKPQARIGLDFETVHAVEKELREILALLEGDTP